MNKIKINFKEFFKSGRFDYIKLGQTKEWILHNFPYPDDYSSGSFDNARIWRYGNYWVLNEENLFEILHKKDIKVIDDTHSIYWVVLTSTRLNIYCYYPKVWMQEIAEEFYDDSIIPFIGT